ncbi:aspartate-semialdehyde dehydrogenase [Phaeobacter sp. QD34_3]|uniref:aspartate-semialdehyde dehydrogenase n=1 Tax=unclassified Phaeobacter TaxID=2621772 RepID=UPI00237FC1DA|nr:MULTISPECIES: aspartate-semialdehyde dehydrogenase [unclassified Phaeobacter]MDE4133468.1 aspartate-semialdehyde dehydrogenase [Phaeobacter sp. QD34_3]MDE4137104.1 aspartate-semialdehyde dehydrogenase [Phaeobacter sp. QD34_24]
MYSHDFERETMTTGDAAMAQTAWSSACDQSRLDTEMVIQLRISLIPIFETATCWSDLRSALQAKGFYMKRAKGHMHLYDGHSHVKICTCSSLGYPSEELEQRFKKSAPTRKVRKLPVRN